ncbi:MAG TPA: amidohydrolase family protein [Allosphingosinicella sp.]
MRRLAALLATLAALLPAAAAAQPAPAGTTYIHAGQLLDRPGRPARGPSTIVVSGGRIAEVRDGHVPAPAGAALVDLADRYVLPGLIDSHVHLDSDAGGTAGMIEGLTTGDAAAAFRGVANARKTLDAGFTTVRNLGGPPAILALRDAIRDGIVPGPRILDAAASLSGTSGHGDATLSLREELHPAIPQDNLCDGAEACRRAVRLQIRRGADVIKMLVTGGVNSPIGAGLGRQMFDDEVKAIVDTAHMYGKKVAVHAHGADGINAALAAGADSIEHGTLLDDESIRLFKRGGAWYVPTLSTVNGYLERIAANPNAYPPEVRAKIDWRIGITGKALQKAVPAGVRIAFGTDAGVSRHGRNADEFELMVRHGMTPTAALEAATVGAADLLGLAGEIGTIEPGKRADIIAVAGDPIRDVTVLKRVPFVMAAGKVFKNER